jgi:hypothetical protein
MAEGSGSSKGKVESPAAAAALHHFKEQEMERAYLPFAIGSWLSDLRPRLARRIVLAHPKTRSTAIGSASPGPPPFNLLHSLGEGGRNLVSRFVFPVWGTHGNVAGYLEAVTTVCFYPRL